MNGECSIDLAAAASGNGNDTRKIIGIILIIARKHHRDNSHLEDHQEGLSLVAIVGQLMLAN